jgi:predicted Rossmann-fold nucleotide-binding protein
MFEALTLSQLKIFNAPIGLLNTNGYYDLLIGLLDNMVESGFLKKRNRNKLRISSSVDDLIDKIVKK